MRRAVLIALVLASGCSRESEMGNTTSVAATPASAPSGSGVDQTYVAQTLAATAFDFRQCQQRPAMQGVAGVGGATGEVIVAIDSSGSMAARSGRGTRMDEAKQAVSTFLGALPQGTRGGVAVFGDVGDNRTVSKGPSCQAPPRFVYDPGEIDLGKLNGAVAALRPAGWTPLANAITATAGRFSGVDAAKRTLFVVSDGVETCGGDPVAAARAANSKARVVVNVIGFGIASGAEERALREVAAAGGGEYRAASPGELLNALRAQAGQAKSLNNTNVLKAMYKMNDCYIDGIKRQRDALMLKIDEDKAAGRINQVTHSALVYASSDRFTKDYGEQVRIHEQNMRNEKKAALQIDDAVLNAQGLQP